MLHCLILHELKKTLFPRSNIEVSIKCIGCGDNEQHHCHRCKNENFKFVFDDL
jgi:hypothetical protein